MPSNLFRFVTMLFVISNSIGSIVYANEDEQVKLDHACEAARQVALKPRRKEIYQECIHKFNKSEDVCLSDAKAYNGNRINGAPLFYELPACEKAFAFRKKHAE